MTKKECEISELTRTVTFARQSLHYAFGEFVERQTHSVSGSAECCEARSALELLRYLRDLGLILIPLTRILADLEGVSLRWLEDVTRRIRGDTARAALGKTHKAVDRLEDKLTAHLANGPPFSPTLFR